MSAKIDWQVSRRCIERIMKEEVLVSTYTVAHCKQMNLAVNESKNW